MKITPVIKRTRVFSEQYEVCPHCQKEIMEKASYIDPEGYVYHSPCHDRGPINKLSQTTIAKKIANYQPKQIGSFKGSFKQNVAGKDYTIEWTALFLNNQPEVQEIKVECPKDMPDYLWFQIRETAQERAKQEAMDIYHQIEMDKTSASEFDGDIKQEKTASQNWLERSQQELSKEAAKNIPMNAPIDDALLADGLGAFLDVFVNYHSGKEGDKIAKWIIAICKDPKFATVAKKLEQFHKLMSDIYQEVVQIAKQDNETGRKVAHLIGTKKLAQRNPMIQVPEDDTVFKIGDRVIAWDSTYTKNAEGVVTGRDITYHVHFKNVDESEALSPDNTFSPEQLEYAREPRKRLT